MLSRVKSPDHNLLHLLHLLIILVSIQLMIVQVYLMSKLIFALSKQLDKSQVSALASNIFLSLRKLESCHKHPPSKIKNELS